MPRTFSRISAFMQKHMTKKSSNIASRSLCDVVTDLKAACRASSFYADEELHFGYCVCVCVRACVPFASTTK